MEPSRATTSGRVPQAPSARHLGDLARSDVSWSVYLETQQQGDSVAGRLHFLTEDTLRTTGWIFLEWSEQEIINRFNDFSPLELWRVLESLA